MGTNGSGKDVKAQRPALAGNTPTGQIRAHAYARAFMTDGLGLCEKDLLARIACAELAGETFQMPLWRIAEGMKITQNDAGKAVKALVEEGYVSKDHRPGSSTVYRLTEKGLPIFTENPASADGISVQDAIYEREIALWSEKNTALTLQLRDREGEIASLRRALEESQRLLHDTLDKNAGYMAKQDIAMRTIEGFSHEIGELRKAVLAQRPTQKRTWPWQRA